MGWEVEPTLGRRYFDLRIAIRRRRWLRNPETNKKPPPAAISKKATLNKKTSPPQAEIFLRCSPANGGGTLRGAVRLCIDGRGSSLGERSGAHILNLSKYCGYLQLLQLSRVRMESPTTVLCKISASQTPTCEKLCGWDAALELSFMLASVGTFDVDEVSSSINAIPPRQR